MPVGRLGNGSPFFFYDAPSIVLRTIPSQANPFDRTQGRLRRRYFDSALPFRMLPYIHTNSIPPTDG
jgi:hypothetical protein